jgi:spermidine/putrescine transport system substrate-binding protein
LTGAVVYKAVNPYKPAIYNFQSYVNPDLIPEIEKKYSYKEYKTTSEFANAINNNKAMAGISTDYELIDLINSQKVSKIDFDAAFGVTDPMSFYSEQTKKQISFFDEYLGVNSEVKGDVDGDGIVDSFSEYIIPI